MKRLVVACDGTWNRPESISRPTDVITNVAKIVRAILPLARDNTVQAIEYVRGVGTGNRLDRLLGGLTGDGVSMNIEQAYQFIANNFDSGDDIYLFGFSRGAFTVRSLSGFLRHVGILRKDQLHRFPEAYLAYRTKSLAKMVAVRTEYGRAESVENVSIPVRFLGVWDTVGHLGTIRGLTERDVSFHDKELAENVTRAYHALAVHELRKDFIPTLWTKKRAGQKVEQVWFPGCHSDIGGGFVEAGLSNLTLHWMADRARRAGLQFDDKYLDALPPDEYGRIHYSCKGKFRFRPKQARDIAERAGIDQYVHPSVETRAGSNPGPRRRAKEFKKAELRACALKRLPVAAAAIARKAKEVEDAKEARRREGVDHWLKVIHSKPSTVVIKFRKRPGP